jgi:hypothetical protein
MPEARSIASTVLADRGALLLGRHVTEEAILGVAMPGDVVTTARGGLDHVGIELGGAAAAEDGGRHLVALERAQDAQQAFVAAILCPLDGAAVDRARLQGRGAREIARAFAVRPGLEQDADQHGDALAAGPRWWICRSLQDSAVWEGRAPTTPCPPQGEGPRGSKPLESRRGTGA